MKPDQFKKILENHGFEEIFDPEGMVLHHDTLILTDQTVPKCMINSPGSGLFCIFDKVKIWDSLIKFEMRDMMSGLLYLANVKGLEVEKQTSLKKSDNMFYIIPEENPEEDPK